MGAAMGIRTEWVDVATSVRLQGSRVAGVRSQSMTNVGPNLGQAYIIDSFMVVVFGGCWKLWGRSIGACRSASSTSYSNVSLRRRLGKILYSSADSVHPASATRDLPAKGRAVESS